MKAFFWLLKAAVFFILFIFALSNRHDVTLHFLAWSSNATPMMLVLLASFALGVILGILVMTPRWWRLRQTLRKQQATTQQAAHTPNTPTDPPSPSSHDSY